MCRSFLSVMRFGSLCWVHGFEVGGAAISLQGDRALCVTSDCLPGHTFWRVQGGWRRVSNEFTSEGLACACVWLVMPFARALFTGYGCEPLNIFKKDQQRGMLVLVRFADIGTAKIFIEKFQAQVSTISDGGRPLEVFFCWCVFAGF